MKSELTYKTIREEILDQKKCQFQLFSIAVTVTSAILAYSAVTKVGPHVYIAPMLLLELGLIVILDKAITIQRKAGYLKMIEHDQDSEDWKWEAHLDEYRAHPEVSYEVSKSDEARKHAYVTGVGTMLVLLATFCAGLYFFGPIKFDATINTDVRAHGWTDAVVVFVWLSMVFLGVSKRKSLVSGVNCSSAIQAKWESILN